MLSDLRLFREVGVCDDCGTGKDLRRSDTSLDLRANTRAGRAVGGGDSDMYMVDFSSRTFDLECQSGFMSVLIGRLTFSDQQEAYCRNAS